MKLAHHSRPARKRHLITNDPELMWGIILLLSSPIIALIAITCF